MREVAHPMDDYLWDVVVGGQLDLELDRGGVVLRLAQIVLAPSPHNVEFFFVKKLSSALRSIVGSVAMGTKFVGVSFN